MAANVLTGGRKLGPLGPNQFHTQGVGTGHKVTGGSKSSPSTPVKFNSSPVGTHGKLTGGKKTGFVRVPLGTK